MMMATDVDKAIARRIAESFAGAPSVHQYSDDSGSTSIAVLRSADRPSPRHTSYSTIGLSEHPNNIGGTDVRVELAGICSSDVDLFPNVLASSAFAAINDGLLIAPGIVFEGAVSDYGLSESLPHVVWVPPFVWPELGSVSVTESLVAHWLLAVPISEVERLFLVDHGFDKFEKLLEDRDVRYFDLSRDSLV